MNPERRGSTRPLRDSVVITKTQFDEKGTNDG